MMKLCAMLLVCVASANEATAPVISLNLVEGTGTLADICIAEELWSFMLDSDGTGTRLNSSIALSGNDEITKEADGTAIASAKLPKGCSNQIYAKKCVLNADGCSSAALCPKPVAKAYDHHDGELKNDDATTAVRETIVKNVLAAANTFPPTKVDQVLPIEYCQRAEFLIEYEAEDDSGNAAERTYFVMIF